MIQGPAFRFARHLPDVARLRFAVPLVALFLTACPPPPPPPPPKVAPPTPTQTEAPPPPLAPSRWVESKGNTVVGPHVADGTLCLLGGRRVLVAKDGTAKGETVHAPEGLIGLAEIATASGQRKIVAYSEHAVYRLDDVLGEPKTLARTEGEVWKISSGPGVVAVWDFDSDTPRFIDVESGQLTPLAHMPDVPANSLAFRNAKEGAAIFEAVGLAYTTDGGVTWKPAGESNKGDATRANDLKLRGDQVLAAVGYGRPEVPLDFAAGKLGTAVEEQVPHDEAPLFKWIRRTERDPLGEAAVSGVLLPSGEALVLSSGMLARVDLKSGIPTEVVEISKDDSGSCSLARAGDSAWLGCWLPESEGGEEMYEPYGVFKISLSGKLAPERPVVKRSGEAQLRTSPSGGVMLLGGCGPEGSHEELCVRQPDGKWLTVRPAVDPFERGVGPLADGRVVYVRGLWEGEDPPEDVAAPPPRDEGSEGEGPQPRVAWIVAMDAQGKEKTLATVSVNPGTDLQMRGYLQEGEDKRIHGVVFNEEGPHVIIAGQGKQTVDLQKVQGAGVVRLLGNFGLAFGEDKLLGSTDGGATWSEIPAPAKVSMMFAGGEDGGYYGYMDDYIQVSDVGIKADQFIRIGWGAQDPLPQDHEPTGGIALGRTPVPPNTSPERGPVCTTDGAGTGAAPLTNSYSQYLVQDFFVKGTPAKGTKRRAAGSPGGRYGMLDPIGAMVAEGPEKADATPAKWTFYWMEPGEIGAKVKSVSGAAPKGAAWDISLRSVSASGSRALFAFRSGTKNYVARAKGASFEAVEISYDLNPSMEVVLGADKGEPIVWLTGNTIVAWLAGEQPRAIATITGRAARALGQPTKDGVPVLLTWMSWGLAKVIPIPALDKKDKNAKPVPHAQTVWLDGWTKIPNFRRAISRSPACGKNPKGIRVVTSGYSGFAVVDGTDESTGMGAYDLRVNGNDVCIAGEIQFLSPISGRPVAPPKDAKDAKAPKPGGGAVPGPVGFLRYDLIGNRAEGGERGVPKDPPKTGPKPPPQVRKLTCKLEEKK